jgi:hypothetical protein
MGVEKVFFGGATSTKPWQFSSRSNQRDSAN